MTKTDGKMKTIMICLVLVISGLFVLPPITGANESGPGEPVSTGLGARADSDNSTNDFPPTIEPNSPVADLNKFTNKEGIEIIFNATITDEDDWDNGSDIQNATLDFGELGITPRYKDMVYNATTPFNTTRQEGYWLYTFIMPSGITAGTYTIGINASDAGNVSNGNIN